MNTNKPYNTIYTTTSTHTTQSHYQHLTRATTRTKPASQPNYKRSRRKQSIHKKKNKLERPLIIGKHSPTRTYQYVIGILSITSLDKIVPFKLCVLSYEDLLVNLEIGHCSAFKILDVRKALQMCAFYISTSKDFELDMLLLNFL